MASDIVWTNHLQERLAQRSVSHNEVFDAIRHPDNSVKSPKGGYRFFKSYPHKQVTVIAENKGGKWIVITAWSKAPGQHRGSRSSEPLISRIVRTLIVKLVSSIQNLFSKN